MLRHYHSNASQWRGFTETLQKPYSLFQYGGSKIPNVNVLTHCDNRARAATHAFPAPRTGKVGQHRECSSCGFFHSPDWTQVDRSLVAAVTALRGNGGTFPSQAQMSDAKAVQERAEGAHTERVILHVRSLCRTGCALRPRPVRAEQTTPTRRASARLGECLRQGTRPNRQSSIGIQGSQGV